MEITGLKTLGDERQLELTVHQDNTSQLHQVPIDALLHGFLSQILSYGTEGTRYRLSKKFKKIEDASHWMGSVSLIHRDSIQRFDFLCREPFVRIIEGIQTGESSYTDLPLLRNLEPVLSSPPETITVLGNNRNKYKVFRGLRIAAVSVIVLSMSIFGVHATMVTAPSDIQDEELQVRYGTEIFPTVNENEKIFLQKVDPEFIKDEKALTIQSIIQPAAKENHPQVVLTSVRSRTIGPDEVALTFDDGPSRFTSSLVDTLTQYNVGATFFLVGVNIPENEHLVQQIHQGGFSIGNHSYGHPAFVTLRKERQQEEISITNQLIESITGEKVHLFRPPYGSMNQTTENVVVESDMKIVLWNKDTEDWKVKNAQELVQYAKQHITGGSIILFHEKQITMEALPEIIEFIQNKGLRIVNLK